MSKWICRILGHKQILIHTGENDHSKWGYYHCMRCGVDIQRQWDYCGGTYYETEESYLG